MVVSKVSFKAMITNITLIDSPSGEKLVKIDLSEEREMPGPVVMGQGSELAREVVPVVSQILRSMPGFSGGRIRVPRLTIYLSEDEWDKILDKPNIGEYLEVVFEDKKIQVRGGD